MCCTPKGKSQPIRNLIRLPGRENRWIDRSQSHNPPDHGPSGQPSCQDLRQRGDVRDDPDGRLDAPRGNPKPGDDLIEDQ